MIIKTWRDPYESGFSPTKPREIELNKGLTVLVGCNGAGKTTLINNIEAVCKENKIPYTKFDNLRDGGSNSWGSLISGYTEFEGDNLGLGVLLFSSSEGETLKLNIGRQSTKYKEFLKTGVFKKKKYLFYDNDDEPITDNKRVLLFDATDSGMSIDAVVEIKLLFEQILHYSEELNVETYIIIAANEYEMCHNSYCFDVNKGQYLKFDSYESYRKFILSSRKEKEKRIQKQIVWQEKQREKEKKKYVELVEKCNLQNEKIKKKAKAENRDLTWHEKDIIDNNERRINDFQRECRFANFD